ncbi:MAG TPA: hypothetical protein VMU06_21850 [Stellaceae bacterium]|nr:hypothetical protein [Stellaceae bacterium]
MAQIRYQAPSNREARGRDAAEGVDRGEALLETVALDADGVEDAQQCMAAERAHGLSWSRL